MAFFGVPNLPVRASHYLDGPTGANWIFRNDLQRERDTALYVDFEEVEPGKFSWTGGDLEYLRSYQPTTKLVLSMRASGLLTTAGAQAVADAWKGIKFDDSTRWEVCRDINWKILNELYVRDSQAVTPVDRDEFKAARARAGRTVAQGWTFPLLHLDLTIENISEEEIQVAQKVSYQQWLYDEFGPFH